MFHKKRYWKKFYFKKYPRTEGTSIFFSLLKPILCRLLQNVIGDFNTIRPTEVDFESICPRDKCMSTCTPLKKINLPSLYRNLKEKIFNLICYKSRFFVFKLWNNNRNCLTWTAKFYSRSYCKAEVRVGSFYSGVKLAN